MGVKGQGGCGVEAEGPPGSRPLPGPDHDGQAPTTPNDQNLLQAAAVCPAAAVHLVCCVGLRQMQEDAAGLERSIWDEDDGAADVAGPQFASPSPATSARRVPDMAPLDDEDELELDMTTSPLRQRREALATRVADVVEAHSTNQAAAVTTMQLLDELVDTEQGSSDEETVLDAIGEATGEAVRDQKHERKYNLY